MFLSVMADLEKCCYGITVTANSNKWQQALGFVSCAQVFTGVEMVGKTPEIR